jgi:anti-anti-sigma factor
MTQNAPHEAGYHTLQVSGELDLHTVTAIEEQGITALDDPAVTTLALDLSNVTFIDSTGIGTLVRLRLAADDANKHLVLRRPSAPVTRLLSITALAAAFTIDNPA